MSVEKYKFISPGIFVSEIDNTARTATPEAVGPVIIGRAEKGPILQPTKVDSFFDFVNTFGEPIPGGAGGDVARDGNYTSPTYGAYAAQAWFRNNAPVTFVRLGGQASEEADSPGGLAGWQTTDLTPAANNENGGAFGLFISNAPSRTYQRGTITVHSATIRSGQTIVLSDGLGTVHTINSGTTTDATNFDASGGTVTLVADAIKTAINLNTIFSASNVAGVITVEVKSGSSPMTDNELPTLYPGPLIKEEGGANVAASLLITAANAPNVDDTIEITAADGTAKTFKATNASTDGTATVALFNRGGASHGIDQLKAAIEASTLAGKVTVSAVGGSDPFTITITQNTAGAVGNKAVTNNLTSYTAVGGQQATSNQFDGGVDGPSAIIITVPDSQGNSTTVANGTFGRVSASYAATTGTLAAVWYIDQSASIALSGTRSDNGEPGAGAGIYFDNIDSAQHFKVQVSGATGILADSTFNFTDTSDKFIRKVFSTNPTLTNSSVTDPNSNSFTRYWLGESFEGAVRQTVGTSGDQVGVILPLMSGTSGEGSDFRKDYQNGETGFFFSQDLSNTTGSFVVENQKNLFKLVARNSGDYVSRNLKVSISDLRAAPDDTSDQPYGSFSVIIRKINDTDNRMQIVERFDNCNLNPSSQDFIGLKIGTKYQEWNNQDKRYREFGDFPNNSKYVYVSMPDEVLLGQTDPRRLPFGVRGPIQFKSFNDQTGSATRNTLVSGNYSNYGGGAVKTFISGAQATNGQINFEFPQLRLRVSASEGSPVDQFNSFFGVDTTFNSVRLDKSIRDHLKVKPRDFSDFNAGTTTEVSFHFTLDDICFETGTDGAKFYAYKKGSRAVVGQETGPRGSLTYLRGSGSYTQVLDAGIDKFTTVFAGGFDGLDITESEPLRDVNYRIGANATNKNSAVFNSLNVAIDSIRDPEVVEYNLASMPGIVNASLNTKLVDMCEARGDALAIIDVKGGFIPPEQKLGSAGSRKGTVDAVVSEMKTNVINSSYAATYYPYVNVRDLNNGQIVTVPPSVAAIGALSYSQKTAELWFAPAGFTRGGLSAGRAGLPVISVKDRLNSRDRDKLYENRINPIAQFPAEGIVIFGQKTLQITPTALDRINVRRLMIFLKREISRFAATILFDQNVQTTWNRFRGRVEPFLRSVQAGLGITDFKLVLDETTTTPDLVDRNILYAKIFIKPARAIEFIAVDFILTDSGAAFED